MPDQTFTATAPNGQTLTVSGPRQPTPAEWQRFFEQQGLNQPSDGSVKPGDSGALHMLTGGLNTNVSDGPPPQPSWIDQLNNRLAKMPGSSALSNYPGSNPIRSLTDLLPYLLPSGAVGATEARGAPTSNEVLGGITKGTAAPSRALGMDIPGTAALKNAFNNALERAGITKPANSAADVQGVTSPTVPSAPVSPGRDLYAISQTKDVPTGGTVVGKAPTVSGSLQDALNDVRSTAGQPAGTTAPSPTMTAAGKPSVSPARYDELLNKLGGRGQAGTTAPSGGSDIHADIQSLVDKYGADRLSRALPGVPKNNLSALNATRMAGPNPVPTNVKLDIVMAVQKLKTPQEAATYLSKARPNVRAFVESELKKRGLL